MERFSTPHLHAASEFARPGFMGVRAICVYTKRRSGDEGFNACAFFNLFGIAFIP
jgi:hypothetical protein